MAFLPGRNDARLVAVTQPALLLDDEIRPARCDTELVNEVQSGIAADVTWTWRHFAILAACKLSKIDFTPTTGGFVILSSKIPSNVQLFLNRLYQHQQAKLFSDDYRALLIRETEQRYPGLIRGLSRTGRTRRGLPRVVADADHIVPRSLWELVMPLAWNLSGSPPPADTLGNLFWRTVRNNRGSTKRGDAFDQDYITEFKREAKLFPKKTAAATHWAWFVIKFFLETKRIEGVNIDVPVQPGKVDEMRDAADVSEVIAFVQRLRDQRPGISAQSIADAVEERFAYVEIDMTAPEPLIRIS